MYIKQTSLLIPIGYGIKGSISTEKVEVNLRFTLHEGGLTFKLNT